MTRVEVCVVSISSDDLTSLIDVTLASITFCFHADLEAFNVEKIRRSCLSRSEKCKRASRCYSMTLVVKLWPQETAVNRLYQLFSPQFRTEFVCDIYVLVSRLTGNFPLTNFIGFVLLMR